MKFTVKTIRRLNVLIGSGLSGFYFYNNAYYLEDIKNKLELKIDNKPAPVPSKIKYLIKDVMDDMALGTEERSLFQVFIVDDFSLKHLGYPDKKFGAFLGVPQHFFLDRTSDFNVLTMVCVNTFLIDKNQDKPMAITIAKRENFLMLNGIKYFPKVGNSNLSPDSPEAWNFKHSLSLSREAKKFAVASELYEAKNLSFYYLGLLPPFVLLQGNAISLISENIKAFGKALPLVHALVFLFALGFYISLSDMINNYTQVNAEYLAASLGTSYIEGGIEYYEKILERNKAVKKLDKNAPYKEDGELKKYMGFRTHSMPYGKRIEFLKDLKRNHRVSEKNL